MNSKTKKNPLRVPATCTVATRKKSIIEFKDEPDPQKAVFEKESSIFLSSIPIGHIQGDDFNSTNECNTQLAKYQDRKIYINKSFSLYFYNSDGNISTFIPYHTCEKNENHKSKHHAIIKKKSYKKACNSRWGDYLNLINERELTRIMYTPGGIIYPPFYIDDPELQFSHITIPLSLPGYTTSCIIYQDYDTKIKELNKTFQTIHSNLSPSLTLSMIREIKRDILKVWICLCHNDEGKYMLEISSFALSFVYFEILIFQKYVTHNNSKLVMCVCLLLAIKFNELCEKDDIEMLHLDRKYGLDEENSSDIRLNKEKEFTKEVLKHFLDEIDKVFGIDGKSIFALEFEVFAKLHFGLHLLKEEFHPYVSHLLEMPYLKEIRIEHNYLEEDLMYE